MKTVLTAVAIAFLGCSVLSEQAQALPQVTGDIGFFGAAAVSGASPGFPVNVSFTNPGWIVLSVTTGSSYDANGVVFGTPATFSNFSFTGDGATAALSPPVQVPAEWSFSLNGISYSFDLQSLTNGHTESANGVGAMAFSGVGVIHATGFDDTPATWALQGSGEGFQFTLSSSTTAAVPEGGVMSLLGLGFAFLAGKGLLGKRKSA
jgi:hypothetical protein